MTSKHQDESAQSSADVGFARQVRSQARLRRDQQSADIEAELERARTRMSLLGRLALGLHTRKTARAPGGSRDDR